MLNIVFLASTFLNNNVIKCCSAVENVNHCQMRLFDFVCKIGCAHKIIFDV